MINEEYAKLTPEEKATMRIKAFQEVGVAANAAAEAFHRLTATICEPHVLFPIDDD